jgi:16S rRNA (guanine527-N7)-methyltransferase
VASGSKDLPESLLEAIHRSREWGFLGDGPIDVHIAHAQGFAEALKWAVEEDPSIEQTEGGATLVPGPWMDLGSGGGIPGLILAHLWPAREATLLDGSERRTRFLSQVVEEQGWTDRVRVVTARAEVAGRAESLRGAFSLVVARSFGSPPVTAECAAPFLRLGGMLIVSEPPTDPGPAALPDSSRWPGEGLATIGLSNLGLWRGAFGYRVLRQSRICPDRFPRRVGIPGKRPLYRISPV